MKADSDLIRRQNRGLVLSMLRNDRSLARIELGRRTGLSPATITAITADLIAEGVLREAELLPGAATAARRGRPLVRLSLDPRAANVLAIRLSVDELEIVIADYTGEPVRSALVSFPTFSTDANEFAARFITEVKTFVAQSGVALSTIKHCGIAVQGLADAQQGEIAWSPAFSARGIPLGAPLKQALGLRSTVWNDVTMIAEAMLAEDRGRFGGTAGYIFLGHGIGMGLIIDGKVFGVSGGSGSEFGHMNHRPDGPLCRCGRRGCIEAYAADYGVMRSARGLAGDVEPSHSAVPALDFEAVATAAKAGEPVAVAAFDLAGEALGYGIARVMALIGLKRVMFVGPGAGFFSLLAPAIRHGVESGVVDVLREDLTLEVVTLARDAIIRGTIATALRHLDDTVFSCGSGAVHRLALRAVS